MRTWFYLGVSSVKLFRLITCSVMVANFCACDFADRSLRLTNASERCIYYLPSFDRSLNYFHALSPSILMYRIEPGDTTVILMQNSSWENALSDSLGKRLFVSFFDCDILESMEWREIVDKDIRLRVDSFDITELRNNGWFLAFR